MREIAETVRGWLAEGRGVAVARVISMSGFGGRRSGEALAVDDRDDRAGALLAGSADGAIAGVAYDIARASAGETGEGARQIEVAVGDEEAVTAGLACGGLARVLVQDAALVPPEAWTSLVEKTPFALATLVEVPQSWSGPAPGSTVLLPAPDRGAPPPDTGRGSTWDPELDRAAEDASSSLFRSGRSGVEVVEVGGSSVMVETFVPAVTRLVVVGEALLAEAIRAQAGLLGWASATYRDVSDPAAAGDVAGLRKSDALVVLSHDRSVDVPALELGLKAGCYVGALGSRHTQGARRERLQNLVEEEALERIHGPVGLDLGARTPEEVALAICAEVLAHRSGRSAVSLRDGGGPING